MSKDCLLSSFLVSRSSINLLVICFVTLSDVFLQDYLGVQISVGPISDDDCVCMRAVVRIERSIEWKMEFSLPVLLKRIPVRVQGAQR